MFKKHFPDLNKDVYYIDLGLFPLKALDYKKNVEIRRDKLKIFNLKNHNLQIYNRGNNFKGKLILSCLVDEPKGNRFQEFNSNKLNEEFFNEKYTRFGIYFSKNPLLKTFSFYQENENFIDEIHPAKSGLEFKEGMMIIRDDLEDVNFENMDYFAKYLVDIALTNCH